MVFQPDALPESVASLPLSQPTEGRLLQYGDDEPMLFVGHYWCRGRPTPIRPNLACLDYSAVMYGKLVAYRLDEETQIDPNKFVWVEVAASGGTAMSPVEALRRPLQEDLSGFVGLLRRLQVPHRVSEERGAQVLWVPSQPLAEQVRALYLSYPQGGGEEQVPTPARPSRPGLVAQLRVSWMTALVLLLTLVVAGVTLLGDNFAALRWLTFQDFQIQGEYL